MYSKIHLKMRFIVQIRTFFLEFDMNCRILMMKTIAFLHIHPFSSSQTSIVSSLRSLLESIKFPIPIRIHLWLYNFQFLFFFPNSMHFRLHRPLPLKKSCNYFSIITTIKCLITHRTVHNHVHSTPENVLKETRLRIIWPHTFHTLTVKKATPQKGAYPMENLEKNGRFNQFNFIQTMACLKFWW